MFEKLIENLSPDTVVRHIRAIMSVIREYSAYRSKMEMRVWEMRASDEIKNEIITIISEYEKFVVGLVKKFKTGEKK